MEAPTLAVMITEFIFGIGGIVLLGFGIVVCLGAVWMWVARKQINETT